MERKNGSRATSPRRPADGNREGRRSYARRAPEGSREERQTKSPARKYDRKPSERKPYEKKASEGRSYGDKPFEKKPYGRRAAEDKPFEKKPYGRRAAEDKPFEKKPYGRRFGKDDGRAYGDRSHGKSYGRKKPAPVQEPEEFVAASEVRLNKYIANSGVCSRREADTYIQTGLVTVNGRIVTELGTRVKPTDDVRFNGERLHGEKKVYILMNKPKDFVTTMSDPHAERTVMDLISEEKCPERVYPVGRLDKATTGVLLFTNDGALTEKLTHPSHKVKKIYDVTLDRNLEKEDFNRILDGIDLEDGPIAADNLAFVGDDKCEIGIEIHSGRNRIVRRIFESLGYKVKKLDRVYFAGLTKKNVRRGEWRFLEESEVNILKMGGGN